MHLIAGLGNPGSKYAGTRHNVGFETMDLLARELGVAWESAPADALVARWRAAGVLLAKPLSFMNLSGVPLGELLRFYKVDVADMLVVVDDIHIGLGQLRARPSGSAGGHNGLKSIIAQLGTDAFPRLRIGVGRGDASRGLSDHVLARFDPEERTAIGEAVTRAAAAARLFVAEGIAPVMNRYNRKEDGD